MDSSGWEEVQSLMFLGSLHTQNSKHYCPTQAQGLETPAKTVFSFALMFAIKGFRSIDSKLTQTHRSTGLPRSSLYKETSPAF